MYLWRSYHQGNLMKPEQIDIFIATGLVFTVTLSVGLKIYISD